MARGRGYGKRRYRKRRRRRYKRRGSLALRTNPFGYKKIARLRYTEWGTLNPTTGGIAAEHLFSANGLYDPDTTGGGQQPMGFDQLMLLYDTYTVIGAKITVWFTGLDSGTSQIVSVRALSDNTSEADMKREIEQGNAKWMLIAPNGTGKGNVARKMTYYVNPNKLLGCTKPLSEDTVQGNAAANPSAEVFFRLLCAPITSGDTAGVQFFVTIDYTAVFTSPAQLARS